MLKVVLSPAESMPVRIRFYIYRETVCSLMSLLLLFHVAHSLWVTHEELGGESTGQAVRAVLGLPESGCSLLLLVHGHHLPGVVQEILEHHEGPFGVFQVEVGGGVGNDDGDGGNAWLTQLSRVIERARKVRRESWCAAAVVVSEDTAFLAAFAEWSLARRLLVWSMKLLVLTRLTLQQVQSLLSSHWTFSMMNAALLNQQQDQAGTRFSVYSHLPYSPQGAQVVQTATWRDKDYKSVNILSLTFFPEKFSNFHGATVNVSVLPFSPYWEETGERTADGRIVKTYSGTDYQLFFTMSQTLNFKINILPAQTWDDVGQLVADRVSFMSPMRHAPLAHRLAIYDFSFGYEYGSFAFSAATTSLRPRWQSLYYPLSDFVWLAVLAVLLFVPASFYIVNQLASRSNFENEVSFGMASQMVAATLLSQDLSIKLPKSHSSRVLVATWLLFAFVVGTVYRGNLTAALTMPKYPPRPETVEDMVRTFDRISMPSYGQVFIDNFKNSTYSVFREMGEKMFIIPDALEAMQRSRDHREAHVGWMSSMATIMARHFLKADGSAEIYLGRESVSRTLTAWPLPHDAPFKRQVDTVMVAVLEAGLYEEWTKNFLDVIERETRKKQRRLQEEEDKGESSDNAGGLARALTLVHMQGPLYLLLLGLGTAAVVFFVEVLFSMLPRVLLCFKLE